MKKYSENEFLNQNEHFTFRLRNLYKKDKTQFNQLAEYLPNPVYINKRESLDYIYFSNLFFSYGKEIENLYLNGVKYLSSISESFLLKSSLEKASQFHKKNDEDSICNYLQCISLNKKMSHFITNKIIIDDEITLNTTLFPGQINPLSKLFHSIIPDHKNCLLFWQRFQSLTKQEKVIVKLISNGKNNIEIRDLLFISKHTVVAHRKNIYKKLEINSVSRLIRFSLIMDLL